MPLKIREKAELLITTRTPRPATQHANVRYTKTFARTVRMTTATHPLSLHTAACTRWRIASVDASRLCWTATTRRAREVSWRWTVRRRTTPPVTVLFFSRSSQANIACNIKWQLVCTLRDRRGTRKHGLQTKNVSIAWCRCSRHWRGKNDNAGEVLILFCRVRNKFFRICTRLFVICRKRVRARNNLPLVDANMFTAC